MIPDATIETIVFVRLLKNTRIMGWISLLRWQRISGISFGGIDQMLASVSPLTQVLRQDDVYTVVICRAHSSPRYLNVHKDQSQA